MKNLFFSTKTVYFLLLLFPIVATQALDEATERRLAIRALESGDYSNAINFFKKALALSENDQEKWVANANELAAAMLRSGDLAGAKELLTEFRRRYPARSAGLLPGKILMAEQKYAEAEKFFLTLAGSTVEPELVYQARFELACARFYQNKFSTAIADLEELEQKNVDSPPRASSAHLTRIYMLLAVGKLDIAEKLLKLTKYQNEYPGHYRRLDLYLKLKLRQFDDFYKLWPDVVAEAATRQDYKLLYDLAVSGASQAIESKRLDAAAKLLNDGFRFAGNSLERRNILRELINVYASIDAKQSADAINHYLELFPEADDRTELLLHGAKLLASAKLYDRAISFLKPVIEDYRVPIDQRLGAAKEAATMAQMAGQPEMVRWMYQYMIDQSETIDQKLEGEYLLGEYLFREKKFLQAAIPLKTVALSNSRLADAARYCLLQSLVELKQYQEAEPVAEALRRSSVQKYVSCADFYRAFLLEKAGLRTEARDEYLKFLMAHPNSEYSPRARFSAAELAMELRDYSKAISGFLEFAEKNPKSSSAPVALYQAMQSSCFAGNMAESQRAVELLQKQYPESMLVIEARLQLADYFIQSADYEAAQRQLTEIEKFPGVKSSEIISELLYDHAKIEFLQRQNQSALKFLEQLLSDYSSSTFGAVAALFAGNIKADQREYREALKFYEQALALGVSGNNLELTKGRIADVKYNLYAETLDKSNLDQALAIYQELADNAANPQVILQSLYKYGKCCELMDKRPEALKAYEKLLYLAGDLLQRGITPDLVWTSRGAYQAVLLNLKAGTIESARRALEDIRLYEEFKFTDVKEDFARIKQQIKQHYKFEGK